MITKYSNLSFKETTVSEDLRRLINQIWKLVPMRENEENWKVQIETVIIELIGLKELFNNELDLLVIITKLEGLKCSETTFAQYRGTVFSIIHELGDFRNGLQ